MKRPTKKHFLNTISLKYGIIKDIAEAYKVNRGTIYNWLEKYPECKNAVIAGKDRLIDLAESKLIENIELGKEKSIIFTLETLGNKRGYNKIIETREISKLDNELENMTDEELLESIKKTAKKIIDDF